MKDVNLSHIEIFKSDGQTQNQKLNIYYNEVKKKTGLSHINELLKMSRDQKNDIENRINQSYFTLFGSKMAIGFYICLLVISTALIILAFVFID